MSSPSRRRNMLSSSDLSDLPRGELYRVIGLFAAAAVVTVTALLLGSRPGRPKEPMTPETAPGGAPIVEVKPDVPPWSPPRRRLNTLIKQSSRLERVQSYPEALNLLGRLVLDRPHVDWKYDATYEDVGGFERIELEKLLNPALSLELRAHPVELRGHLTHYEAVDAVKEFQLDPALATDPRWSGTIRVDGRDVDFLILSDEPAPPLITGQDVKVQGVFYRLRDVYREHERDGRPVEDYVTVPLILAKKVVPALEVPLVEELPPDFADGISHAMNLSWLPPAPQSDPLFMTMVGYSLKHWGELPRPEDEVIQLKGRGLVEEPEKYVLKYIRARGEVVHLHWENFALEEMRPGDAPTRGFWHCMLSHAEPAIHTPISLLIPKEELPTHVYKGAVLEATGIFFRVHAYENKVGSHTRTPLVVAVRFPVEDAIPSAPETPTFLLYVIGAGLFMVAFLSLMLMRDRRKARLLDEELRKRRVARRKAAGMDLNQVAEEAREGKPAPEP